MDSVDNTVPLLRSHLLGYPSDHYSAIAQQRPLFTEPLLATGVVKLFIS
jgi:hypothetical protein